MRIFLCVLSLWACAPVFCLSQAFSGGVNFTIVRCGSGIVFTYGDNQYGQIGDNTTTERDVPTQVLGPGGVGTLTSITHVGVGRASLHSLALRSDNTVWSWGLNNQGQLGDNTTTQRNTPVQVKDNPGTGFLTGITAIAGGYLFSLALKSDGTVWAWGENGQGQLGDNTTTDRYTPVQVKDNPGTGYLTSIVAISAGNVHSMALKSDGTVWVWGDNSRGAVGDNTTTDRSTPTQMKDAPGTGYISGITAISASDRFSMMLKSDGSMWGTGWNSNGQLGDNTTTQRLLPVQVKDAPGTGYLTSVSSMTAGYSHCLALLTDGSVWAWGDNSRAELGDNTSTERHLPVHVKDPPGTGFLSGILGVSAGDRFSMAWKNDFTVWGWGWNTKGGLGDGTNGNQRNLPVQPTNALCNNGGSLFPLPVSMLHFSSSVESDASVLLSWSTASEQNNDRFEVERSDDGQDYVKIGEVKGAGNSASVLKYGFQDLDPSPALHGTRYYRLRQVDFDGRSEYYGPVSAHFTGSDDWFYAFRSVVGQQNLSASFWLPDDGLVLAQLISIQGQVLSSRSVNGSKGNNSFELSLTEVKDGIYFIRLSNGCHSASRMFVKMPE